MKNKNTSTVAYAALGIISLIAGLAAARHQEKRYRKEAEELEKESKFFSDYASMLTVATEQYKSEVEEMSALADDVLMIIEESENDLDEEEEL